jgi:hypothetical protein
MNTYRRQGPLTWRQALHVSQTTIRSTQGHSNSPQPDPSTIFLNHETWERAVKTIWLVRVYSESDHTTPAPRMGREASSGIEDEWCLVQLD